MKIIRFEINQAGEFSPAADGGNLAEPSRRKSFQRRNIFRQKNINPIPQTAAVAHGGGFFVRGEQRAASCAAGVHWLCNGRAAGVQRLCIENRGYDALWGRFWGWAKIGCATVVRQLCNGCAAAVFSLRLPLIYNKKKIKEIDPPTLSDERDSPAAARGRKFFWF